MIYKYNDYINETFSIISEPKYDQPCRNCENLNKNKCKITSPNAICPKAGKPAWCPLIEGNEKIKTIIFKTDNPDGFTSSELYNMSNFFNIPYLQFNYLYHKYGKNIEKVLHDYNIFLYDKISL